MENIKVAICELKRSHDQSTFTLSSVMKSKEKIYIKTKADFENINLALNDEKILCYHKLQLRNMINTHDGIEKNLRNILKTLFDPSVKSCFTWSGNNNTAQIKNTKLFDLIIGKNYKDLNITL